MKKEFCSVLVLGLGLMSGCNVETTALVGDGSQTTSTWDKASISGPTVEGRWSSDCVKDSLSMQDRWKKISIAFTGENVERQYGEYSDSGCTTSTSLSQHKGVFHFIEQETSSRYVIEYKFDGGSGFYFYMEEKLALSGNQLYVSNLITGTGVDVMMDLPMVQPGTQVNPAPAPAPAPAPVPAPVPVPVTDCANLTGTYQMNSDYFKITQSECAQITWKWQYPQTFNQTFVTDGVVHAVDGRDVKAYYQGASLFLEYTNNAGNLQQDEYRLNPKPCRLFNPNGSNYLERVVKINGETQPRLCRHWAPSNY